MVRLTGDRRIGRPFPFLFIRSFMMCQMQGLPFLWCPLLVAQLWSIILWRCSNSDGQGQRFAHQCND